MMAMSAHKKLLFIADTGPHIGYGHMARCLALAEAAHEAGFACHMISQNAPALFMPRIKAMGLSMHSPATDMIGQIKSFSPAAIILDSYVIDDDLRARIMALPYPTSILDDERRQYIANAALVTNPSPFATASLYRQKAPKALLALGPEYALLGKNFWPDKRASKPFQDRTNILITFGGADPQNLSHAISQALLDLPLHNVIIDLVVPEHIPISNFPKTPRLVVHQGCSDLSQLMANAGLAIAQVGGTMGELAAMGVPSLILVPPHVDQRFLAPHPQLDWCLIDNTNSPVPSLALKAQCLWQNSALRAQLSARATSLIDGRGAIKLIALIQELIHE